MHTTTHVQLEKETRFSSPFGCGVCGVPKYEMRHPTLRGGSSVVLLTASLYSSRLGMLTVNRLRYD